MEQGRSFRVQLSSLEERCHHKLSRSIPALLEKRQEVQYSMRGDGNRLNPVLQLNPYTLVNNDRCLLDICDMVLLDPVTCGYGVLIDPKAASEFFGTDQDAAAMEDCVLNLPTMAATRYYHEPVEGVTQEEFIDDCYTFAADAYLRALYLGNRLPKEELAACIQKLSYFTGIPESWFSANGLRITAQQFPKVYGETALGKVVGVEAALLLVLDLH